MTAISPDVEIALRDHGFVEDGAEGYVGRLAGRAVRLRLPPDFPYVLPRISVEEPSFPVPFPHVEEQGVVCLGLTEGLLVDAGRPAALINEAIARATRILQPPGEGPTAADYAGELAAYWKPREKGVVWSLLPPGGPTRTVAIVHAGDLSVVAETGDEAARFMKWSHRSVGSATRAWWFSLEKPIVPPGSDLTLGGLLNLITRSIGDDGRRTLKAWDGRTPPRDWLLSCPDGSGSPRWLLGARLPILPKRIEGFTGPTLRALRTAEPTRPVARLGVAQMGAEYLLRRGGSNVGLRASTAIVIGAGAIGGYLVANMASLGVGKIHIVDPDDLSPDNMYRHYLGFKAGRVGRANSRKSNLLQDEMREKFPHLNVDGHAMTAKEFFEKQPGLLSKADVIVSATGSPSVNMFISRTLRNYSAARIYVWLEAHGIGGHVFLESSRGRGCYSCLYAPDDEHGLVDLTSFYEPGQDFTTVVAGCHSTFTPFGALDAQRAATECGRLTQRVLQGGAVGPTHVRWREELPVDVTARTSGASANVLPGQRDEIAPTRRTWGCRVCGI